MEGLQSTIKVSDSLMRISLSSCSAEVDLHYHDASVGRQNMYGPSGGWLVRKNFAENLGKIGIPTKIELLQKYTNTSIH